MKDDLENQQTETESNTGPVTVVASICSINFMLPHNVKDANKMSETPVFHHDILKRERYDEVVSCFAVVRKTLADIIFST